MITLVVIKVVIYMGIKNLQRYNYVARNVCVNGYYGLNGDPFECDVYYSCPDNVRLHCEPGHEFDNARGRCVELSDSGCTNDLTRRLLL